MIRLKYILKLFVLVLFIILQVHGTLYTRFSFNPVTLMGLMYYDDLYKYIPIYILYVSVFAFQCLISFLLIFVIFKRINLLSCIFSFATCLSTTFLFYNLEETGLEELILRNVSPLLENFYCDIYGSKEFLYYNMGSIMMQTLLLYFYGICQVSFFAGKKYEEKGTSVLYLKNKTNWRTIFGSIRNMIEALFTLQLVIAVQIGSAQNTTGSYALRSGDELTKLAAEYMPGNDGSQDMLWDLRNMDMPSEKSVYN